MNIIDEDIIKKILTTKDPNSQIKVLKWNINNNIVAAGTNYCSEVSRLTISYEKDDIEMKRIIFLKVPVNCPMFQSLKNFNHYEKEMIMYTKILPQMYTIEEKYFTARHYFYDDKMSLFLKDLSLSGYKNANRLDQLDVEHSCYALKCLAKFHALSVKIERTYGLPDIIKTDSFFHTNHEEDEIHKSFLKGIPLFIDHLADDVKEKYPELVAAFQNITWESLVQLISPKSESFNVLNHGDFWVNNIMFKYDKYSILKKVKILDFQLCRWASPAIDLIYFFITSVRFEVYEKYFDLLLEIYLSTLNKVLVSLECQEYKMKELLIDIKSRYTLAYVLLSCALPFIMSDPNDPIDMEEMCSNGKINFNSASKAYKLENFVILSRKWFIHFANKGKNS